MEKRVIKSVIDFKVSDDDNEALEPGSFTSFLPQNEELIAKTNDLVKKLNQKNNEIERLCILLDTMEPVPGLDVEKYRKLIENSNTTDTAPVDYRDTKIVQLAKKIRRLTVTLNKEHATAESRLDKIDELENKCINLQTQLVNANSINKDNNKANIKISGDPEQLKRELEISNKQVTDLKHKNFQLNEEIKALTRALTKEVGDGANIEEIMKSHNSASSASNDPSGPKERGWRGRAQQITMLKAKVKKLEQQLVESTMNSNSIHMNNNSSPSSKSGITDAFSRLYNAETESTYKSKRFADKEPDADQKAMDELMDMANQRKEAMEIISQEHAHLIEQNQMLETKVTAGKARIKNLETDCLKHKQQVKVMIDKTETDDQLISALRDELERLREQLVVKKAKDRKAAFDSAPKELRLRVDGKISAMPQTTDPSILEVEVQRLQRLCKQQQAQIATHEQIIVELRNARPTKY